jgi:exopolysaccharide biosynthesis polyprenyl glycosylphosphotransferase
MVKHQTRLFVAMFVLVDVLCTAAAWVLAYYLRFHSEAVLGVLPAIKGVPPISRYLLLLPLIALLWPAVMYFHGLYQVKRGRSRIDEFFAILFSVLIASAFTLGATLYVRVYYRYQPEVAPLWEYSQAVFGLFVAADVLLLNLGRSALRRYLQRMWAAGHNVRRVLIAGAGDLGEMVAETLLAHRELGYRVVGFLDDRVATERAGLPVLGTLDQAMHACATHRVDQLYVALPLEDHAKLLRLIKSVGNECVDIKVVPDLVQYATIKAALEDLDGIPIISLNEVPLRGWNSMAKRVMDFVFGSLLLLLLLPFFLAIAALIRLRGGKGPILLRQERMTLDGKTFEIFKFRTMDLDADSHKHELVALNKHNGNGGDPRMFKIPNDPRVTRSGSWLRRFSIDELPQLINVVRGEMSLVGPRPLILEEDLHVVDWRRQRLNLKPGITGLWQVLGRDDIPFEEMVRLDYVYVTTWSMLNDLKLILRTIPALYRARVC